MRTFKLFALTICLILVYGVSKASQQESKAQKLTVNFTMQAYLNAVQHGKLKGFSQVIDEDAKFTMQRGDKVISQTKSEILQAMKKQENVEQNCEVSQSVVQTLPNQTIMKVDMKYETFTRTNFVTLSESNNGWRVSQVSSIFQ